MINENSHHREKQRQSSNKSLQRTWKKTHQRQLWKSGKNRHKDTKKTRCKTENISCLDFTIDWCKWIVILCSVREEKSKATVIHVESISHIIIRCEIWLNNNSTKSRKKETRKKKRRKKWGEVVCVCPFFSFSCNSCVHILLVSLFYVNDLPNQFIE